MRRWMALCAVVASSSFCVVSHASWEIDGTPVCTAAEDQRRMVMVPDGAGGVFIAWDDQRTDYDIYAQHVDAQGNMMWRHDGLVICDTLNTQTSPKLTPDGSGGVIIAWTDRRGGTSDIYAQRVDADGNLLWQRNGKQVVTYTWDEAVSSIVGDGNGGAIVVWQDSRASHINPIDVYAQRINSNGDRLWDVDGVALCTQPYNQTGPIAISDGIGGAIVCWRDDRETDHRLYAQRVSAGGAPLWTIDGEAVMDTTGDVTHYDIVTDGAGGAIIAWTDHRSVESVDLYAQRLDANGGALWQRNGVGVCIAPGPQANIKMIPESGGAIIAYDDTRTINVDIYARKITAAGDTLWQPNGVPLSTASGVQYYPFIITDGSGGAIVTWYDFRFAHWDVYAQRVSSGGAPLWTADGVPVSGYESNQEDPQIVTDGAGGGVIAWIEYRNWSASRRDIYVGGVDASGNALVPTLLADFSASTEQDRVVIEWRLSDVERDARFLVSRRENTAGGYAQVGTLLPQGDGLSYTFTDENCRPGKSYRYRIDVADRDGHRVLFETADLTLPRGRLSLEQNVPNPFNPATTIRFYLDESSPVTLGVFDTRGRWVATLLDEDRIAGWNELTWDGTGSDSRRVSSGLYFYRLKVGNRAITKKMVVVK